MESGLNKPLDLYSGLSHCSCFRTPHVSMMHQQTLALRD